MSYLYANNVSPADRFDKLEMQLDDGSTAILQRGKRYDLTPGEVARASKYIALVSSTDPADSAPVGVVELPVVGNMSDGQVPVWDASLGAFVPGDAGAGSIIQTNTGDPTPTAPPSGVWIEVL